jgi:hypothetical protein
VIPERLVASRFWTALMEVCPKILCSR